ncbi:MAG: hypothetical protein HY908_21565 [Myxococcales bacterium]|nr:hypothetical protein [Myxococcales bacterium]
MSARDGIRRIGLLFGGGAWLGCALAGCLVAAEDAPRPELDGVPFGGFGGSPFPGGAGGTGGTTTTSGTGGSGGEACGDADPGGVNDTEPAAWYLGGIDDCDGAGSSVAGALDAGDVDWYRYTGTDASGCIVDPAADVSFTGGSARLCQFAACMFGSVAVTCQGGSAPATSPDGRAGCCGSSVSMDIECTGINDDAFIYLRLDQPSGSCVSYVLDYHY